MYVRDLEMSLYDIKIVFHRKVSFVLIYCTVSHTHQGSVL